MFFFDNIYMSILKNNAKKLIYKYSVFFSYFCITKKGKGNKIVNLLSLLKEKEKEKNKKSKFV